MKAFTIIAKPIIQNENYPIRFENFCIDLYTEVCGREVTTTSPTWDIGIDGRSLIINGQVFYLCSTIDKNWEPKVSKDLFKISQAIDASLDLHLIYCLNIPLTEYAIKGIRTEAFEKIKHLTEVDVLSLHQIAAISEKHQEVFFKHYASEYEDAKSLLFDHKQQDDDFARKGFQIAISTQLNDDALVLRSNLLNSLILQSLHERPLTFLSLANNVSKVLHLEKSIGETALQSAINSLEQSDSIIVSNGIVSLTSKGLQLISEMQVTGTSNLLEGRKIFKESLSKLLGQEMDDEDFRIIWKHIQSAIAFLFYNEGLRVTQLVTAILDNKKKLKLPAEYTEIVHGVADDVATRLSSMHSKDVVLNIRQSVFDVLHGENEEAFNWLSSLGVVYISLLSLGLDTDASKVIHDHLKQIRLLLDTNVVLDYLCEGERGNKPTVLLLNRWLELGGMLQCPQTVLDETCHHAFNADYEYNRLWRYLHNYTYESALEEINNAFLRAFCAKAQGKYHRSAWAEYMDNFRSSNVSDTSRIEAILSDELKCSKFQDNAADASLVQEIADYIFNYRKNSSRDLTQQEETQLREKCYRDGILLSSVFTTQDSQIATYTVISSSSAMHNASQYFAQKGIYFNVLPWNGIAFLMSLLPEARLQLSSLKGAMFDVNIRHRTKPLEQYALNVIRETRQGSYGFSRRTHLARKLDKRLSEVARQEGFSGLDAVKRVKELFAKPYENMEVVAPVLKDVIEELYPRDVSAEIAALKKQIAEQQKEIEFWKSNAPEKSK
jgi:hypothetical protein